jgi:hypothetical protein
MPLEDYGQHVRHPRFGNAPRITGLDPDPDSPAVHLHWNTRHLTEAQLSAIERVLGWRPALPDDGTRMVPATAIEADLSRQTPATMPVTHYYDLDKVCRDCGLRFIFFAEDQKYWYEELGFPLEADAVRCQPCRRHLQQIERLRKRYEQLSHVPNGSADELLEMADCCLTLVEEAVFHARQIEHVRMLLNRVPENSRSEQRFVELTARLRAMSSRYDPEGSRLRKASRCIEDA